MHCACVLPEVSSIFSFIVLAVMSLKQSWELILLAYMISHKTSFVYLSKDVLLDVLIYPVFFCVSENYWKSKSVTTCYVTFPSVSQKFEARCGTHSAGLHASSIIRLKPNTRIMEMLALWLCLCATAEEFNSSAVAVLGVAEELQKGNSNYAVFIPPWYHISLRSTHPSTETQKCF